jgi:hypothetical protein
VVARHLSAEQSKLKGDLMATQSDFPIGGPGPRRYTRAFFLAGWRLGYFEPNGSDANGLRRFGGTDKYRHALDAGRDLANDPQWVALTEEIDASMSDDELLGALSLQS